MLKSGCLLAGVAAACLCLAAPAQAEEDLKAADVKICVGEIVADARLKCFDDLAKAAGFAVASPTTRPVTGKWVTKEDRSKMDDSKSAAIILMSDDRVPTKFGAGNLIPLYIRCEERTTNIFVATGMFMDDQSTVTYRLDQDQSQTTAWRRSSNRMAIGLWDGNSAIPFVKKMFGRKELIFRFTPYDDAPRTATFTIEGIDEAIKPLREACKW